MWQKVNLNDKIRIKRTPEVDAIILEEHEEFWQAANPEILEIRPLPYILTQDTEYYEMELWSYMNQFGKYFFNGADVPDELINIELQVK